MLGTLVDVAIGMTLLYLLLSLLASGLQELIASLLHLRGARLRDAVAHLLGSGGGAVPVDTALFRKVYGHALVSGMNPSGLPSYVPARNVASAIVDALSGGVEGTVFTQVENAVSGLPEGRAKSALTVFVRESGGDLDKLKSSIETWFDDAMDRVGGAYRRFSHYCLLAVGVVLAAALNIDSFRIASTLWTDAPLRAQLVSQAQAIHDAQAATPSQGTPADVRVADASKALAALPLPIGWRQAGPSQIQGAGALWAILGWLVTAFAIALGAPFWFDALDRLLKLRQSGGKPKRSDER